MDDAKQQLTDKLKSANNILVTVSRDPSVDQLSALLGLTLVLNKQGKHAAAVFSGQVPSTLEFLQPEETIEKNTDSLRDFIIALDKSKADKLRYKVEDNVVRIFITPYKTSISQDDFDFSQGDFNVDLVVAIGVQQQEDLDEAITAHGRILHDATVASINTTSDGGLGTINWHEPQASSLSELATQLVQSLGADLLDEQIANALLTGIVAETDRFRNDKTSAQTMTMSAALMAAGANQQLVASQLEEPPGPEQSDADDESDDSGDIATDDDEPPKPNDGAIQINHDEGADEAPLELPSPDVEEPPEAEADASPDTADDTTSLSPGSRLITEPPTLGGTLTANSSQERLDPANDVLGLPTAEFPQLLDRKSDNAPAALDVPGLTPPPPAWVPPPVTPTPDPVAPAPTDVSTDQPTDQPPPGPDQTLTDLETAVQSDVPAVDPDHLDTARDEVSRALNGALDPTAPPTEPIQALNAQPFDVDLHPEDSPAVPSLEEQIPGLSPTLQNPTPQDPATAPQQPQVTDPTAPPPVPPPIPFQFGNPPPSQ